MLSVIFFFITSLEESTIERYFRDYGYLHERLGNALSYLKDPREFFWKQKAKKEAAVLIQDPELAALQREAKEFFPEGQLYAKYTDFAIQLNMEYNNTIFRFSLF